jgi:predicted NBD/HSP70 family sugar kinase
MIIDRDGPLCECGLTGCWEALAATRWLREQATVRDLPQPKTIGAARLSALAPQNAAAAALLEDYAANIGVGIANLQQILGIGLFIVHGEPVGGGEALRSSIERHVRRQAFAHPGGEPRVVFADPDDYATLRGAASIVLSRSLDVAF